MGPSLKATAIPAVRACARWLGDPCFGQRRKTVVKPFRVYPQERTMLLATSATLLVTSVLLLVTIRIYLTL